MSAATRSKTLELHEHTATQRVLFLVLVAICIGGLYLLVAVPAMDGFFDGFLRMSTLRDGQPVVYTLGENRTDTVSTSVLGTWALIEATPGHTRSPLEILQATYVFKPLVSLTPLVLVGGFVLASLLTVLLPGGYVRQKIERELLTVLDRLAFNQFGEHTTEEIRKLMRDIAKADLRNLHDLAEEYGMQYIDLELLQSALRWREATGMMRLLRTHDAVKFYMREYFTDRYSNSVLGAVYIGAAVLIIVIGIRGLKFLPATDPSMVLGALGLEFMLLITYAVVMMYGRAEDSNPMVDKRTVTQGAAFGEGAASVSDESEQLLRAFLAIERKAPGKDQR